MIASRDATVADLPAIDALFRDSFTAIFGHLYAPHDLADFLAGFTHDAWAREHADPAYAFRVTGDPQGLTGYAKLGPPALPIEPRGPAVELRHLYMADRAKGSGAAQALMNWSLDTARARGAGELWLSVYVDNVRARRFYERYGFEDAGRYSFMVGAHEDEDRLMRVRL